MDHHMAACPLACVAFCPEGTTNSFRMDAPVDQWLADEVVVPGTNRRIPALGELGNRVRIIGIQRTPPYQSQFEWDNPKMEKGMRVCIPGEHPGDNGVFNKEYTCPVTPLGVNPKGDAVSYDKERVVLNPSFPGDVAGMIGLQPEHHHNSDLGRAAAVVGVFIRSILNILQEGYSAQETADNKTRYTGFATLHAFEPSRYNNPDLLPIEASFGWMSYTHNDTNYRVAAEGVVFKRHDVIAIYDALVACASRMLAWVARYLLSIGLVCTPNEISFRVGVALCCPRHTPNKATPAFCVLWIIPAKKYIFPMGAKLPLAPIPWIACIFIARLSGEKTRELGIGTRKHTLPLCISMEEYEWRKTLSSGIFVGKIRDSMRAKRFFEDANESIKDPRMRRQHTDKASCDALAKYYADTCPSVRLVFGANLSHFRDDPITEEDDDDSDEETHVQTKRWVDHGYEPFGGNGEREVKSSLSPSLDIPTDVNSDSLRTGYIADNTGSDYMDID